MRNLDITTLRSFVAVAEAGGVTRAAGFLHLTQSAVSMQLKRLEELLGLALFDRSGRTIALTASGEQLLAYARRMVALTPVVQLPSLPVLLRRRRATRYRSPGKRNSFSKAVK